MDLGPGEDGGDEAPPAVSIEELYEGADWQQGFASRREDEATSLQSEGEEVCMSTHLVADESEATTPADGPMAATRPEEVRGQRPPEKPKEEPPKEEPPDIKLEEEVPPRCGESEEETAKEDPPEEQFQPDLDAGALTPVLEEAEGEETPEPMVEEPPTAQSQRA